MIDHKELMRQGQELIAVNLAECCREELEWQNTALLCSGKMREAGAIYAQVDAAHALSIVQSEVARQAMQVVAAAPQVVADELAVLNEIADLFSIGAEARKEPEIILANARNTVKFANLLHAVEREFFMSPDDENECLVNCWGSTEAQYLDSMRAALQAAPVQAQEPFMFGIMGPDGKAHIDENCVAGDKDSTALHIEVNCLNDSPDTGYSIVPLYAAPVQPVAVPDGAALVNAMCKAGQLNDHGRRTLLNGEEIGFDLSSLMTIVSLAAPAAQGDARELPPLPDMQYLGGDESYGDVIKGYTAECMQQYARAAIAAKAAS